MKKRKLLAGIFLLSGLFLFIPNTFSQDPNFYIYLCFGQSNMEGQGTIEAQDMSVDSRFQVMEAVECSNLGRTKGSWYTATPPLCRCYSGLSPADYFGRTMVENLPDSIKIGIVNVSVAGCKVELFDKTNYQAYVSSITEDWLINIINEYGGNPYAHLVDVAKLAQKDGVIKGILLHQGESNTGDASWPAKVKGVYDNLIADLALNADSVPLLAGEVVNADQGGICASMNTIIARLPQSLPNSYVISSKACTDAADNLHFNPAGYRKIGIRYAIKMLSLYGIEVTEPVDPVLPENTFAAYFEAECATVGGNWDIIADAKASNKTFVMVKPGIQSINAAATGSEGAVVIPFSVDTTGNFKLYARLYCPTADDDSYWVKMDNDAFAMSNGLTTSGWQWKNLNSYSLTAGEHVLTITYREDGARLDKICISNYVNAPTQTGDTAENICAPLNPNVGIIQTEAPVGYALGQNYPNPFNEKTTIGFEIPNESYVSLKVFDTLGAEMAEIAGKVYKSGQHTVTFNPGKLPGGSYFYTFKAGKFSTTRSMMVMEW